MFEYGEYNKLCWIDIIKLIKKKNKWIFVYTYKVYQFISFIFTTINNGLISFVLCASHKIFNLDTKMDFKSSYNLGFSPKRSKAKIAASILTGKQKNVDLNLRFVSALISNTLKA